MAVVAADAPLVIVAADPPLVVSLLLEQPSASGDATKARIVSERVTRDRMAPSGK